MHPVRRIAAFLLLAFWLPALLHCRLEAAGLMFGTECCDATHQPAPVPTESCADDSCDVAEGEFAPLSQTALLVPAPLLFADFLGTEPVFPSLVVVPPPVTGVIEAAAAPPEIASSWVFVSRAALSPRAPSLT